MKGVCQASIGIVLGLLSLLLTYYTVLEVRLAVIRAQSTGKLKQMAIAVHGYADDHLFLPPVSFEVRDDQIVPAEKGKGLSWRVALLPYIEQSELFRQFHLDEPWDSRHNKKLLGSMPATYRRPGDPESTTQTPVSGFRR